MKIKRGENTKGTLLVIAVFFISWYITKNIWLALDYALITAGWLIMIDSILGACGSAGVAGFSYALFGLIIAGFGLYRNGDIVFAFAVPVALAVYAFFKATVLDSLEKHKNKVNRRRRA